VVAPAAPPRPVEPQPTPRESQPDQAVVAQTPAKPQVWVISGKYLTSLICISGNTLLAFDVPTPEKAQQIAARVAQGTSLKQLYEERDTLNLTHLAHVPVNRIISAVHFSNSLKITWVDQSRQQNKVDLTCDKANQEAVLQALQQRLGARYQLVNRPISRGRVLISTAVLMTIVAAVTGFCTWEAQGLATVDHISGSARTRGLANLILLIGPGGFLCIGGLLFIFLVIVMVASLAKPPLETALLHDSLIKEKA